MTGAAPEPESPTRPPRTVEELLDREETLAKAGLERSASRLRTNLENTLDLGGVARRHPYLSVAVAAAVGVVAGPLLVRALLSPVRALRLAGRVLRPLGRAAGGAAVGALWAGIRGSGRS